MAEQQGSEDIGAEVVKKHEPRLSDLMGRISTASTNLRNFEIENWRILGNETSILLEETAKELDEMGRNVGISTIAGGSAATLGGLMTVGAVLASPFTLGFTLPLAVGGTIMGLAGGVTAAGAQHFNTFVSRNRIQDCDNKLTTYSSQSQDLLNLLNALQNLLTDFKEEYERINEQVLHELRERLGPHVDLQVVGEIIARTILQVRNVVLGAQTVANSVMIGVDIARFSRTVQFGEGFLELASRSIAGSVTVGSALFTSATGVLSMGFGIYDIVQGANALNGTEAAQKLRDRRDQLEVMKNQLEEGYLKLS